MNTPHTKYQRPVYQFLAPDFTVTDWSTIRPYYEQLLERNISSPDALRKWFTDRSELEGALTEDFGWRYIKSTCDTTSEAYQKSYEQYVKEILPETLPYTQKLNEQVIQSPHLNTLSQEAGFDILARCLQNSIRVYQAQNIPLLTEAKLLAQQYGHIVGEMTVKVANEELTLQQAVAHLESPERTLRETVYQKISQRRLQDQERLHDLYTQLIRQRHQIALNAGFKHFTDYSFVAMNRFDYTPQDCFDFHNSVAAEVVPLQHQLAQAQKEALEIPALKPWDAAADPTKKPALRPFENTDDLLQKTIQIFDRLDPFLGNCLRTMEEMGHLDLASRKGKAPGGYNYPLDETGVPFIFMNATSTLRDMVTMLHEGGHAVHSFLVNDLPINDFKHPPSEIAELASMTMELLTIEHWGIFFEQEDDLKRAKKLHLKKIVNTLTWVATIDAFQHWVYTHPNHSLVERRDAWISILHRFSETVTDWSGQEVYQDTLWQKQLHLFEVPFYYIEYGMAQLGALALWKRYHEAPEQTLKGYLAALKLGYTHSIPEVYAAAGISFDFSRPYIQELIQFLKKQLYSLE